MGLSMSRYSQCAFQKRDMRSRWRRHELCGASCGVSDRDENEGTQ